MITKSRARASLAEVMTRHKIKFTDAALTEMVAVVFGEKALTDPLTVEGRRAMTVYAECVGYRANWTVDYAHIFNTLGQYPSEEIRRMFAELKAGEWYVKNKRVPTAEAMVKAFVAEKANVNPTSKPNEYSYFV
jgi:hypothetical protein